MDEFRSLERRLMKIESLVVNMYDELELPKKVCPVCGSEVRLFTPAGETLRPNAKCPVCKSLERMRFWWLYFKKIGLIGGHNPLKLLHFAPERELWKVFSKDFQIDYWPVDLYDESLGIREKVDITDIPYGEEFDIILCNHVLEHIQDDGQAMKELYRVLKPGGTAYISVPMSGRNETFENSEYNTPELRSKYFGQKDHVRVYGGDFTERLEKAGFTVRGIRAIDEFSDEEVKKYGLIKWEILFECRKQG